MQNTISELETIARKIRARIVEHSHRTGTPHLGSCLSCVDILVALYFGVLDIDPKNPLDESRDRFILSKGHGAPALFQVLSLRGFFPYQDLLNSDHEGGGVFGEHPPAPGHLPGIEAATGSLGHGLPIAIGMMLAAQIKAQAFKSVVLLGDGECNEGSIWEAAMFAGSQRLENIAIVVDFNKWQATDRSQDVMALDPLEDKWRAFGWDVHMIDGHNMEQLVETFRRVPNGSGKPIAIVANTVKGRGISFMEDDNNWHYRIPNSGEVQAAFEELKVMP